MTRRRTLLTIAVIGLVLANGIFLYLRWHDSSAANAEITYVGLDSLVVEIPASTPAFALQNGRWHLEGRTLPDLKQHLRRQGEKGGLPLIELVPPIYGRFVGSVRDLKARGICNVAVRDAGPPLDTGDSLLPALILCGKQIGDAGFSGNLPADGPIHLPMR